MAGRGDCVLVVDGEELVRWSLRQRLEEQGYRVLQASTARAALGLDDQADLILLEVHLPEGDGRGLARHLRHSRPERPLVVMTADCSPELERLVRGGTVDAVVEKPFGLGHMLELVRQYLHPADSGITRLPSRSTRPPQRPGERTTREG